MVGTIYGDDMVWAYYENSRNPLWDSVRYIKQTNTINRKEVRCTKDLTGKKFGMLTVLCRSEDHIYPNGRHDIVYKCLCDCGKTKDVLAVHLRSGHTKSCGCYREEKASDTMRKHGDSKSRLFVIWKNMKARCLNKNKPDYRLYGGRGITIDDSWKNDYVAFKEWANENGYNDALSLDRIDVNSGYSPDNCRWVTQKQQCNNTRRNIRISYNGEVHTLKEWSEITGIKYGTLCSRIYRGWDIEKALTR